MPSDYYDKPLPSDAATAAVDRQVANAATYLTHQAYHIRRALERIADALENKKG